jgi:hypothetical protein
MSLRSSDQEQIFESDGQEDSTILPVGKSIPAPPPSEDVSTQSLNALSSFDFFHSASLSSHTKPANNSSSHKIHRINPLESPYERYLRLKMELNELSEELQEMQDIQSKDKQSIWALLQEETKKLCSESDSLMSKFPQQLQVLYTGKTSEQEHLHSSIFADIQNKLQTIPSSSTAVMMSPSSSSSSSVSEKSMLDLEQRVYRLEAMLGIHSNYLDLQIANHDGFGQANGFPLAHIVQKLEQKVALLDNAALDMLRTKFVAFKNEVAGSSTSGNDAVMKVLDAMKKLDHFIDNVAKIDAVVDELPIILTRLKTLEGIHWNASMFASRLELMEKEIQSMAQEVASNQDVLEEIKIGLKENLTIMQENVQKVESRLARANL